MKNRGYKRFAMLAILCVLVLAFAVPAASAASYSKVYGQTQAKVRVRESASTNATIIDNIVKGACVYVTSSKTSGSNTFIQVKYRASDGNIETGWICQSDGKETYVKILSATQAKSTFSVSDGNLPSKNVGTFTAAQRKASVADSDNSYIKAGTSSEAVKDLQTKLKALKFYSGEITGSVGDKTEAAIKAFQRKYNLTADGIAGPQTLAKIDAVYAASGASTTTTTTTTTSSSSNLKLGSTGTAVRDLQTNLTTLGFYWAEITGKFGEKTETAVKRFQEENGLTADGVAGPKTIAAIEAAVAKKGVSTTTTVSTTGSVLKLNSQGNAVSQLQENLRALGYYSAQTTGNFGSKTEAAVKLFQQKNGLTVDGIAGSNTLAAIAKAVGSSGSSSTSSASGLKLGTTSDSVRALQQDLTTLGYYYGDVTGHYGSLTEAAVKKFQKARGLTVDGVAGTTTLEAVASALKGIGSTSAGSSTTVTLREGDKNNTAIGDMQQRLKTLGYYYGEITNNFGTLTKNAVRKFQQANGLTVDGIAGPATLTKLYSLTGGSTSNGSNNTSSSGGTTVSTTDSYGRITKNNVNLRSSYSTTSAAKASLKKDTLVRITKTATVSGVKWYYISVHVGSYVYTGYVRSDMMETITEEEYNKGGGSSDVNTGDEEVIGMIRVTGDNVALRYEPSTSATKVGSANKNDVFYYIDSVSGWFQTKSGYWISKDYAKVMTEDEVKEYTGGSTSSSVTYRYDSTGEGVTFIQTALAKLGYYKNTITDHFGTNTEKAVKAFQRDNGLTADGIVGEKTMKLLQEKYYGISGGDSSSGDSNVDIKGDYVYDLNWYTYKTFINAAGIKTGNTFTLTDIVTGKSFNVKVQSTGQHADVEPATASDTAIMCSIYGVSSPSSISYVRRAMIATSGEYQFVCSMYGQPHGSQTITNNNYNGQFCIHFRGSKTSGTLVVREENQTPIDQAVAYVKKQGKTVITEITSSTK